MILETHPGSAAVDPIGGNVSCAMAALVNDLGTEPFMLMPPRHGALSIPSRP